jgi:hypothetical protein
MFENYKTYASQFNFSKGLPLEARQTYFDFLFFVDNNYSKMMKNIYRIHTKFIRTKSYGFDNIYVIIKITILGLFWNFN